MLPLECRLNNIAQFSGFGKVFIIILMFVGRLGPVNWLIPCPLPKKEIYSYPEGKITIG